MVSSLHDARRLVCTTWCVEDTAWCLVHTTWCAVHTVRPLHSLCPFLLHCCSLGKRPLYYGTLGSTTAHWALLLHTGLYYGTVGSTSAHWALLVHTELTRLY